MILENDPLFYYTTIPGYYSVMQLQCKLSNFVVKKSLAFEFEWKDTNLQLLSIGGRRHIDYTLYSPVRLMYMR